MEGKNIFYFNLLKREVASTFLENHSISDSMKDWKGDEIVQFQEHLLETVKATVSEKWFYTYFKNDPDKLPRIDMLNLLSEYVGYENWSRYKSKHVPKSEPITSIPIRKKTIYFFLVIIPILGFVLFGLPTKNEFQFCFVDDLLGEPIVKIPLNIKIINKNESPISIKTDGSGCFRHSTSVDYIKFVVNSPYHQADTIVRRIENSTNQNVQVTADDYALMLKYYTEGDMVDWLKHKEGLEKLIANEATIYKINRGDLGVELFTKDDFVRLLTIPTSSLKRIRIVDKTLLNDKIVKLKFIML